MNKNYLGHIACLFTISIWGTTFISTKVLLQVFSPIEILIFRFVIGYIILFLINPSKLVLENKKDEKYFIYAALSGIVLYFTFENFALKNTLASNAGVIISTAPLFTAIFANIFTKTEKLTLNFMIGFISAIIGIILITINSNVVLKINPLGDFLIILAALVWGIYSIITKKISSYNTVLLTRRIFFYGILFSLPLAFFTDFKFNLNRFFEIKYLYNILFLGIGASALCFVAWNYSVKIIGAVKTSVYIYATPVVTIIASVIILNEKITLISIIGTIFILFGLVISEKKPIFKPNKSIQ